jgi:hypothetical protein
MNQKDLEDAYEAYITDCNRRFYLPLKPIVSYPHLSKEITHFGFPRDELTLTKKILKNLHQRKEKNLKDLKS